MRIFAEEENEMSRSNIAVHEHEQIQLCRSDGLAWRLLAIEIGEIIGLVCRVREVNE
jgi:hypothetical protein